MSRYYEPVIWHQMGTKGHSVYHPRTFAMPVRRHGPVVAAPRYSNYSNVRHDYAIDDSIHRADYLSNAVLEDTYEAATRSRGKDNELLRSVNAAIVSTEQHISPRAATVSRRVRASTAPPVSRPLPGQQVQQHQHIQVAALARQPPPGPVYVMLVPNSSYSPINHNIIASKPVVLSQGESPWSVRARAGSVPPPDLRGLRGVSLPPRPRKPVAPAYHAPEPIPSTKLWAHAPVRADFRRSARATSVEPQRRHSMYDSPYRDPLPSSTLWAHRPRVLRSDASLLARARAENRRSYPGVLTRAASEPRVFERASDYYYSIPEVKERALSRYLYAHRGKYGPETKPPRPSLGNFPQVYVPWNGPGPSNRSKAAIIGSRMEADGPKRQRRPRSEFAANKLRELKRDELEEGIYYRTPSTGALHASRPPLPKPTDRKAIRDVDGFTKPKNLLSWQYRVESRLSPDDIIYEPSSFIRMRERVKDVQEKMDRQRQLLDRYLDSDFKIAPNPSQKENITSRKY